MAEDLRGVAPRGSRRGPAERRHGHLVEQVAEKGRFRQDLDVDEVGMRLERNGGQLVAPVQPARRVNVDDRHRVHEPPAEAGKPAAHTAGTGQGPLAEDVVAVVDSFQERRHVRGSPRLRGRRDESNRLVTAFETALDGTGQVPFDRTDDQVRQAARGPEQLEQFLTDRLALRRIVGQHDHAHRGVGERIAVKVGVVRVERLVGRGHASSAARKDGAWVTAPR